MRLDDIAGLAALRQQVLAGQCRWSLPLFYNQLSGLLAAAGLDIPVKFRLASRGNAADLTVADFALTAAVPGARQIIAVWVHFASQHNMPFYIPDYFALNAQATGASRAKTLVLNVVFHRFCQILIEHHHKEQALLLGWLGSAAHGAKPKPLGGPPAEHATLGWVLKLVAVRSQRHAGLAAKSAYYLEYALAEYLALTPVRVTARHCFTPAKEPFLPLRLGRAVQLAAPMLGAQPPFAGFAYNIELPELDYQTYLHLVKNKMLSESFKTTICHVNGNTLSAYLVCQVTTVTASCLSDKRNTALGLTSWLGTPAGGYALNTFLY